MRGDEVIENFSLHDWLFSRVVCGCGQPAQVVGVIHDTLDLLQRRWADPDDPWPDASNVEEEALFGGDDRWRYLTYYWLDNLGLTDHGGSVPGFLTDRGEQVLAALEADVYIEEGRREYHALNLNR